MPRQGRPEMTTDPLNHEQEWMLYRGRLVRARRVWRIVDVAGAAPARSGAVAHPFPACPAGGQRLSLSKRSCGGSSRACLSSPPFICSWSRCCTASTRRLTDEMVATQVERNSPGMDNRLINAVLLHKEKFEDSSCRRWPIAARRGRAVRGTGGHLRDDKQEAMRSGGCVPPSSVPSLPSMPSSAGRISETP